MIKLEIGLYTKQLLFSALGSTDLSNIKRTLNRYGYKYTTNNKRGINYRLIINAVPVYFAAADNFRKCCKEELGITESIDFDKLAILICFLEYDINFVDLTLEKMESRIKDKGFILSRKTIAKYLNILEKNNILTFSFSEYVYYIPLNDIKFISDEQWKNFWIVYYNNSYRYSLNNRPYRKHKRYFGNSLVPAYYTLVYNAKIIVKEIIKYE